jgi:hypothetical protein
MVVLLVIFGFVVFVCWFWFVFEAEYFLLGAWSPEHGESDNNMIAEPYILYTTNQSLRLKHI